MLDLKVRWAGLAAAWFLAACTPSQSPSPSAPPSLDPTEAASIEIHKSDPVSGDRWDARLVLSDAVKRTWTIADSSGPTLARALVDRRADSTFVEHLLDTFKTLKFVRPSDRLFETTVFRIRASDSNGKGLWDFELGPDIDDLPNSRLARSRGQIYEVQGSALQMLTYLSRFEVLRHQALSTFKTDEIDEVEVHRGKKLVRYAQRESGVWVDQRRKALPGGTERFESWLEEIVHLRARRFVDDEQELAALRARLQGAADPLAITFKDRHGQALRLSFARIGNGLAAATVSSREGAVFEVGRVPNAP